MSGVPTQNPRSAEPFHAFVVAPVVASRFGLSWLLSTHRPLDRTYVIFSAIMVLTCSFGTPRSILVSTGSDFDAV
jgi:hypothetical protein